MRFMFSFPVLEHGFINGCKWFIGADGCHLTGPYSGVLLSEATQQCFPLSLFASLRNREQKERWFLSILMKWRGIENNSLVTFMTATQKGIFAGLMEFWSESTTRQLQQVLCYACIANVKGKWLELVFRILFWLVIRTTYEDDFNNYMKNIKEEKKRSIQILTKIDKTYRPSKFLTVFLSLIM